METIHQRMPVILRPEDYSRWLDVDNDDRERLESLLLPYAPADLVAEPVSTLVNNPRNEDARCRETIRLPHPDGDGTA